MIKTILFSFLFAVAAFAQRTPLKINGTIVNNPNFTNTASLSWAVTGSDIRGTAAGSGGTTGTVVNAGVPLNTAIPTYSDTTGTNITPSDVTISARTNLLAGTLTATNNGTVGGTLSVTGSITNDVLTSHQLLVASAAKVIGTVATSSTVGAVLVDNGAGAAPSYEPDLVITGTNAALTGVLTANGGNFTNFLRINGVDVSTSSGGIAGTVINTGTPAIGNVPYYTDTTGTNISPLTTGFYSGAVLTPWVGTNNALTLQWKKAPVVWEFIGGVAGDLAAFTANSGSSGLSPTPTDTSEQGLWSISTGSLTNGTAGFRAGSQSQMFTTNSFAVMVRLRTPSSLSSNVDGYELYAGLGDSTGDAAPVDGAYFFYSHLTSNGVWTAKSVSNSSVTFASGAPSEITVAVSTWYSLLLEGTSSLINFWVSSNDGVTWQWIGFVTGNIPNTTSRATGFEAYIRKIGGSTGTAISVAYLGRLELWPNRSN